MMTADEHAEFLRADARIQALRNDEYPMLKDAIYLDYAGAPLISKLLVDAYSKRLISGLYANPHSLSPSSQLSTSLVEAARLDVLKLFEADPDDFDIVFVANATAGIKLVADAFRDAGDFWYGYHKDSHTSLVGARELASSHHCFESDHDVMTWISEEQTFEENQEIRITKLFAYPAQSNMDGRRLPLQWASQIRSKCPGVYTLLDAAAFASTSPLSLSDAASAPDFVVISLYKMFGLPDQGVLLVRREASHCFDKRKYFGGGTVDMVLCLKEQWHASKSSSVHDHLEDGTLPIHNIMAITPAIEIHRKLFHSFQAISQRVTILSKILFDRLRCLRHRNGRPAIVFYIGEKSQQGDAHTQGPIVAFNIVTSLGGWISAAELEKLCAIRNIHLRTGGVCNPGGVASSLGLAPWEMKANFSAGQRCSDAADVLNGKPTGVVRASLGSSSTLDDVERFVDFVAEFFVDNAPDLLPEPSLSPCIDQSESVFYVKQLSVYPIKSCAAWKVPDELDWAINPEGLAWDREWCIVHKGSGVALSQKQFPRMALVKPEIDLAAGILRVGVANGGGNEKVEVSVPLSSNPRDLEPFDSTHPALVTERTASVCGDTVTVRRYRSAEVADFLTQAIGIDCQLARFSPGSARHTKQVLRHGRLATQPPHALDTDSARSLLFANESPILLVAQPSVDHLSNLIQAKGGKSISVEVFRANIVVAPSRALGAKQVRPFDEDNWVGAMIGAQEFRFLGACRRCQMICIDQKTAAKNSEPFVTLAKTRRVNGKVVFGQHACHVPFANGASPLAQSPTVRVGEAVSPLMMSRIQ